MPQSWFITGASSGLGRSLTELVLAEGDAVTAAVRLESQKELARSVAGM